MSVQSGAASDAAAPSSARSKSVVSIALDLLALSLWLGGLVTIGAVVAPVAFHALRSAPELANTPGAPSHLAGSVVGGSLRVFNIISAVCGAYLLGSVLAAKRLQLTLPVCLTIASGAAVALLITIAQAALLFPAMDAAQAAGNMGRFDALHHIYELLADVQLVCLFWFTGCYAWLVKRVT